MKYYYVLYAYKSGVTQELVVNPVNIYKYTKSVISNCGNLQLGII